MTNALLFQSKKTYIFDIFKIYLLTLSLPRSSIDDFCALKTRINGKVILKFARGKQTFHILDHVVGDDLDDKGQ